MKYTNQQVQAVINDYIHNETYRRLLTRRFVDGICIEPLAEEFGLSVRHTKRIIAKYRTEIFSRL